MQLSRFRKNPLKIQRKFTVLMNIFIGFGEINAII